MTSKSTDLNFVRVALVMDTRPILQRREFLMKHTKRMVLHYFEFRVQDPIICKQFKLNLYVILSTIKPLQLIKSCNDGYILVLEVKSATFISLGCLNNFQSFSFISLDEVSIYLSLVLLVLSC